MKVILIDIPNSAFPLKMLFEGHILYFNIILHNKAFKVVPNSSIGKARI